jgi:hypothetical protein
VAGPTGAQGIPGTPGAGSPGTAPPIMDGIATVGVLTTFSREDHIHPSDTSRVNKAGDRMTGSLRVGSAQSATARADVMSANIISAENAYGYNAFLNAASTNWIAQVAGYGGYQYLDTGDGSYNWYSSAASVAAGGNLTLAAVMSLSRTGLLNLVGNLSVNGASASYSKSGWTTDYASTYGGYQHIRGGYTASFGVDGTGTAIFNISAGGVLALQVGGTTRLNVSASGALLQYPASGGNNFDSRGFSAVGSSAIVGFTQTTTLYGLVGHQNAAATWYSFYGNVGAFLAAGVWAVSDGRLKEVSRNVDPSAALAAVNAIAVKNFTLKTPAARAMFHHGNREINEPLYGWIAQEIEPLIPIAVTDVRPPDHDIGIRAAIKGVQEPEPDSDEAKALGAEDITLKTINDRYMLTTLWAAVQQLSMQNDALRAELDVIKAAMP